jgi:hypothetical protein
MTTQLSNQDVDVVLRDGSTCMSAPPGLQMRQPSDGC